MACDELCFSGGSLTKYRGRLASEITATTSKMVAKAEPDQWPPAIYTGVETNGRHFAEVISCYEKLYLLIQFSPTFAAKGLIDSNPALVR